MDPEITCRSLASNLALISFGNRDVIEDALEQTENLKDWFRKGGFDPSVEIAGYFVSAKIFVSMAELFLKTGAQSI